MPLFFLSYCYFEKSRLFENCGASKGFCPSGKNCQNDPFPPLSIGIFYVFLVQLWMKAIFLYMIYQVLITIQVFQYNYSTFGYKFVWKYNIYLLLSIIFFNFEFFYSLNKKYKRIETLVWKRLFPKKIDKLKFYR